MLPCAESALPPSLGADLHVAGDLVVALTDDVQLFISCAPIQCRSPNLPIFEVAHDAALAALSKRRLPYTTVPGTTEARKVRRSQRGLLRWVVVG